MTPANLRSARLPRLCAALSIAIATVMMAPVTAQAAIPSNDDAASPVEITDLPFTDTVDTTEATAAEGDVCGQATVWYSFTPDSDGEYFLNSFGSNGTTLGVLEGTDLLACGFSWDGPLRLQLSAGTTYLIEAGSCCGPGTPGQVGPGDQLQINVERVPPAPTVELTLQPVASLSRDSSRATVRGTVTCTDADHYYLDVTAVQIQGRNRVLGYTNTSGGCSSEPSEWTAVVDGGTRLWSPKTAAITLRAGAYNSGGHGQDELSGSVKMTRR